MNAYRCIVHGRVQGVGFRYWTMHTARTLGLKGWVRNCADGTVEVQAQGDDAPMEKFMTALHTGPGPAKVTGVQVDKVTPNLAATEFTILP